MSPTASRIAERFLTGWSQDPAWSHAKPFQLTPKEKARAVQAINDQWYTIVVRPQPDDTFLVAAVDANSGRVVGLAPIIAGGKWEIPRAIKEVNRDLDKFTSLANKVTDLSRSRRASMSSAEEGLMKAMSGLYQFRMDLQAESNGIHDKGAKYIQVRELIADVGGAEKTLLDLRRRYMHLSQS